MHMSVHVGTHAHERERALPIDEPVGAIAAVSVHVALSQVKIDDPASVRDAQRAHQAENEGAPLGKALVGQAVGLSAVGLELWEYERVDESLLRPRRLWLTHLLPIPLDLSKQAASLGLQRSRRRVGRELENVEYGDDTGRGGASVAANRPDSRGGGRSGGGGGSSGGGSSGAEGNRGGGSEKCTHEQLVTRGAEPDGGRQSAVRKGLEREPAKRIEARAALGRQRAHRLCRARALFCGACRPRWAVDAATMLPLAARVGVRGRERHLLFRSRDVRDVVLERSRDRAPSQLEDDALPRGPVRAEERRVGMRGVARAAIEGVLAGRPERDDGNLGHARASASEVVPAPHTVHRQWCEECTTGVESAGTACALESYCSGGGHMRWVVPMPHDHPIAILRADLHERAAAHDLRECSVHVLRASNRIWVNRGDLSLAAYRSGCRTQVCPQHCEKPEPRGQ